MMSSFLNNLMGNPLTTPIGQMIEQATEPSQASENWPLYMDICDKINYTDDGPQNAIKAIKKLMFANAGKNNLIVVYTLSVLETCVKNCGHRFHVHLAEKDFLQELSRILHIKDISHLISHKILNCLQIWSDAFQNFEELKEVDNLYKALFNEGFKFPDLDFENVPPIHTPVKKQTLAEANLPESNIWQDESQFPIDAIDEQQKISNICMNNSTMMDPMQMAKLKSELDVVLQNCKVFSEMLTENSPSQEADEDWLLLKDLNETSIEFHKRMVELVEKQNNEQLTAEVLPAIDEINNVLLRFKRYERMRNSILNPSENSLLNDLDDDESMTLISADSSAVQGGKESNKDKIPAFYDTTHLKPKGANDNESTFNPFAEAHETNQLRRRFKTVELDEMKDNFHKPAYNSNPYINQDMMGKELEVRSKDNTLETGTGDSTSVSNQEFDMFLASKSIDPQSIVGIPAETFENSNLLALNDIDVAIKSNNKRDKEGDLFSL